MKMQVWKLLKKLSSNYLISSLIMSITIFAIFMLFTTKVKSLPLDFNTFLETTSSSILIGYQFSGIRYFFSNVRSIFAELMPLFKENRFQTYFERIDNKMQISGIYHPIIILTFIPFILLEIFRFWKWKNSPLVEPIPLYFSLFEPSNHWAILLDIINHIIEYFSLLMLAIFVGIIINLIIVINELNNNSSINIDIFHFDEMGGLRPLRNFVIITVTNYFIILTLAMISYVSPREIISYETILLIGLLILGVIFFVMVSKTIRNLINKGLKFELNIINREYKAKYTELINIISNSHRFDREELEKISFILDLLEKEKIKIKQISLKRYDFNAIVTFISSFLIPTITLIEKIQTIWGHTSFINYILHLIYR